MQLVHDLYDAFVNIFTKLPLVAVNDYFLFVHAGAPGNGMSFE